MKEDDEDEDLLNQRSPFKADLEAGMNEKIQKMRKKDNYC